MRSEHQLLPFRIDPFVEATEQKELAVIKAKSEHGTLAILDMIRTQLDRWTMGQSCRQQDARLAIQWTLPWVVLELPKLVGAIRIWIQKSLEFNVKTS